MLNKKQKSSLQLRNIEYAQFTFFSVLSKILLIFSVVIVCGSFWFLYTRTYMTIGKMLSMTSITPFAKVQMLDIESYEIIQVFVTQKKVQTVPILVRDPFNIQEEGNTMLDVTNDFNIVTSTESTQSTDVFIQDI
jgi:hypothetical protein